MDSIKVEVTRIGLFGWRRFMAQVWVNNDYGVYFGSRFHVTKCVIDRINRSAAGK